MEERLFFAVLNEETYMQSDYRFNMNKTQNPIFIICIQKIGQHFKFLMYSHPYEEIFSLYSVKINTV